MMHTAAFTGSFDPFTIGHDDIVRRALLLFERIVIGIGYNEHKQYMEPAEERCRRISSYYEDEPRVEVMTFNDLAIDFCQRIGVRFIVKGVRSLKDFEYEREQAELNRRLGGVETLLLLADPSLACVSSSAVRELAHFGQDIQPFLPKP